MAKEFGRFIWYKPESIGYFTKCTPRSVPKDDSDEYTRCIITDKDFSMCNEYHANALREMHVCMEI